MEAIIQNDPKGEIQAAIDSIVKRSLDLQLALLAPCLIDGHTADESVDITVRENAPGGTYYKRLPIASRSDGQGNIEGVYFNLCARCGVVYEEKSK